MNKITLKCFKISRAYFRKIKHPGIGHFVKKCPFFKKKTCLNLIKSSHKQPPPALLDYPTALLSEKGVLLLK